MVPNLGAPIGLILPPNVTCHHEYGGFVIINDNTFAIVYDNRLYVLKCNLTGVDDKARTPLQLSDFSTPVEFNKNDYAAEGKRKCINPQNDFNVEVKCVVNDVLYLVVGCYQLSMFYSYNYRTQYSRILAKPPTWGTTCCKMSKRCRKPGIIRTLINVNDGFLYSLNTDSFKYDIENGKWLAIPGLDLYNHTPCAYQDGWKH